MCPFALNKRSKIWKSKWSGIELTGIRSGVVPTLLLTDSAGYKLILKEFQKCHLEKVCCNLFEIKGD